MVDFRDVARKLRLKEPSNVSKSANQHLIIRAATCDDEGLIGLL